MQILEKLTPLFFALDHVNYSRWMPVHIKDMSLCQTLSRMSLKSNSTGSFLKLTMHFLQSTLTRLEQENAYVKSSGGCIGLTENPVVFRHWMLSGPELVRLQKQFEEKYFPDDDPENPRLFQNHEQGLATQKAFQKQVSSLFKTFF